MRPYHYLAVAFLFLCNYIQAVEAQRNVTIDDIDQRINYQPPDKWGLSAPTDLNAGGAHMLTSFPGASATFTFNGTAIYFMSPLWPYHVTTALQLDNRDPDLLILIDQSRPDSGGGPETVPSSIVWGVNGLENTEHRLLIYVGAAEPFAIVDQLIYTTLEPDDGSGSGGGSGSTVSGSGSGDGSGSGTSTGDGTNGGGSSGGSGSDPTGGDPVALPSDTTTHTITPVPPTSSANSSNDGTSLDSNASDSDDGPNVLAIVLGVIFGLLGLALIIGLIWLYFHKKKQDRIRNGVVGAGGGYSHNPNRDSSMSEEPDYRIRDSAAPIAGYYTGDVSQAHSRNQDPSFIGDYPNAGSNPSYTSHPGAPYQHYQPPHTPPPGSMSPGMAGVGSGLVSVGAGAGVAGAPVPGAYSRHTTHSDSSSNSSVTTYLHQQHQTGQPAIPPAAVVESRVSSRYHNTLSIITENSNPSLNNRSLSQSGMNSVASNGSLNSHPRSKSSFGNGSLRLKRSGGSIIGSRPNSGYQILEKESKGKGKEREVVPADGWEGSYGYVPSAPPTSRF